MLTITTPDPFVLDLFAGPGGWDQGILPLGIRPLGVEWDTAACATARAAGHERLQADIAMLDPREVANGRPVRGLIASPPCQGFSMAGKGKGRDDTALLLKHLAEVATLADLLVALDVLREQMTDARSLLALEPLRWALTLTPSWLAWEQVPAVMPLWDACAVILRRIGYTVDTGLLSAEAYGVPQTRKRAILVARAPWFTRTHGPAQLPAATHSRYYPRNPAKRDEGVPSWVSMADALTWDPESLVGFARRADGGEVVEIDGEAYRARDLRPADRPAQVVTEKSRSWTQRSSQTVAGGPRAERAADGPSLTVTSNVDRARWVPDVAVPGDTSWTESPSPTIVGSFAPDVVAARGYRKPGDGPRQSQPGSVRVTVAEAAVLQSFPADYPWQGSKTAQYRQVGDAVPPLLASHIVAAVAGVSS